MKKGLIAGLLGIMVASSFLPVPSASAAGELPTNRPWTKCADENGFCSFEGTKEVRFGTGSSYMFATATNGIACSVAAFENDPAGGVRKQCEMRDLLSEGTPEVTGFLSGDFKTLTIAFDRSVVPADEAEDLKSAVTVRKTGTEDFAPLDTADTVSYDAADLDKLVLSLAEPLVGKGNAVAIAANALVLDEDTEPYAQSIVIDSIIGADITPPAFIGAEKRNSGYEISLHFDESLQISYPADVTDETNEEAYLLSSLQIAQDGEHFSPLVNGLAYGSVNGSKLVIGYNGDLKLVSGPKTKLKLAAGLLKDDSGNSTPELTLSVSPPAIRSAELSADNHDVTVTFDRLVYATPFFGLDELKSRIRLMDSSRNWNPGAGDTASITGNKLLLHMEKALSGETTQISIQGGTLQDANGNYSNDNVVTAYLAAHADGDIADTTPPEYVNYLLSPDLKDLTLIFNEDLAMSEEDIATFKNNVYWRNNWMNQPLPSSSTVTVSGRTLTIHFESFSSSIYYIYGNLAAVKDLAGNYSNSSFSTWYFQVNNGNGISLQGGYVGLKGGFLGLYFGNPYSEELVDLTADENGGSRLYDLISISSDNGATYQTLSAGDKVVLQGNQAGIFLKDPIKAGTVQVKIAAGAFIDSHRYRASGELKMTIAQSDSRLTGYLFSDADTVLKSDDDSGWSSRIRNVKVWDRWSGSGDRDLTGAEYSVAGGKLTIAKGVFLKDRRYLIEVEAEGYGTRAFDGEAFKSSDIFYMTAPAVTKTNGIAAKVFIYNQAQSDNAGTQSVVFELFDGTTPVGIASSELMVGTGTYTVKFNVSDAASKAYTVKAFLVSSFDSGTMDLGLSLGTVKTQAEIDEAMLRNGYND